MKWALIRATIIAALAACLCGPADAHTYRNSEFGMMIPLPAGFPVCRTPPDRHDHGPVIFLDRLAKGDCENVASQRYIGVFGNFNSTYLTLDNLYRDLCREGPAHRCSPAPPDLTIRGWRSRAGRAEADGGWMVIQVFALTGTSHRDTEPSGVDYSFVLHTRKERLDDDLKVFRRVLAGSRLWRTTLPFEARATAKPSG